MRIQKTRLKSSASDDELSCLGPAPSSCPGVTLVRALAGDGAYLAVQLPQLRVVPELLQDDGPPLRGDIFALGIIHK